MAGMQCFSGPSKICQRLLGIRRRDLMAATFLAQACPASVSKGTYILLT